MPKEDNIGPKSFSHQMNTSFITVGRVFAEEGKCDLWQIIN